MDLKVTDVEQLKKRARKLVAGQVLAGGGASVSLALGPMRGCRACMAAGFGPSSLEPRVQAGDRLLWVLDGHAEVHQATGEVIPVSQGQSTILAGGSAYRLVFPTLTIFLDVESEVQA